MTMRIRGGRRDDAIVVGVGGMGSVACCHLARRARRVLGRERFDVPHAMGSSHGVNRTIRLAYYTPDEYFVFDRHPIHPQMILASPCSGHDFKFCSVIGEILADLAERGETRHDIGQFRLGRFSVARPATAG